MAVPERLWRHPTKEAIDSLAKRFGLANHPGMQDWEWEVADPGRIDEFLSAYEGEELSEDERFTLMETLLQSFENLDGPLEAEPRWSRLLELLDRNVVLHAHSICYWSVIENDDLDDCWRVTPFVRRVLRRHPEIFYDAEDAG
jgi:hypothetical protein